MDKGMVLVAVMAAGGIGYLVGEYKSGYECREMNNQLKAQLQMKHENMLELRKRCD